MSLHILTACSRPENLPMLARSIAKATLADAGADADVSWHLRIDALRTHVGGQALKNRMLREITEGIVWVLDDDTLVHPQLFASVGNAVREARENGVEPDAVVVSQKRADGGILLACRENVKVGKIDIGQAILRRDLIGDERIPLSYDGDGIFLEKVLAGAEVVFLNDVLSFHNALA